MKDLHEKAIKAVHSIVRDISERHGLAYVWEEIDDDLQAEIMAKWTGIIVKSCAAEQ